MTKDRRLPTRLFCIGTLLLATTAQAGGLWVRDYGDSSMARANAGEAAGTDDAATILHNPAGMTRLEGSQVFSALTAISSVTEFDIETSLPINGSGNGGAAGGFVPAATLAYVHDTTDRLKLGFSIAGLSGAALDYNDNWVGRFQATEINLLVIAAIPAIAYQVTDRFSVGASMPVLYADIDMKLAIPDFLTPAPGEGRAEIDGDDVVVGFSAGAIYDLGHTRFGMFYQSEFEPDFSGDLKIQPPGASISSDTTLTFARIVRFGVAHDIDEQTSVYLSLGWDDWSALEDILLATEAFGVSLPQNWSDTYHVGAGLSYRTSDRWQFNLGLSYDSSPVDPEDRTAYLPVDRQVRIAGGAQYTPNSRFSFGANMVYVDLGDARIEAPGFSGEYDDNAVVFVSLSLTWTP